MRVPVRYDVAHDPRLEALTAAALDGYARSLGWLPEEGRDGVWQNSAVVGDDGTPFVLTIPDNDAPDFYHRAGEVVRQLSQYEGASERDILTALVPRVRRATPKPKPTPRTPTAAE